MEKNIGIEKHAGKVRKLLFLYELLKGGFHLVDLIITKLKSHMICFLICHQKNQKMLKLKSNRWDTLYIFLYLVSFLPSRYRLKRRCLHNLINRHKVQMAIENEQNDPTSGEANKQTNENDKAANDIPS